MQACCTPIVEEEDWLRDLFAVSASSSVSNHVFIAQPLISINLQYIMVTHQRIAVVDGFFFPSFIMLQSVPCTMTFKPYLHKFVAPQVCLNFIFWCKILMHAANPLEKTFERLVSEVNI